MSRPRDRPPQTLADEQPEAAAVKAEQTEHHPEARDIAHESGSPRRFQVVIVDAAGTVHDRLERFHTEQDATNAAEDYQVPGTTLTTDVRPV